MSASFSERLAARRAHGFVAAAHLAAAEAMAEAETLQADRLPDCAGSRSMAALHASAARAHEAAAQSAILVQFGADAALSSSATLAALAASRAADPDLDLVSAGYSQDGTSPLALTPSERIARHSAAALEHWELAGCR